MSDACDQLELVPGSCSACRPDETVGAGPKTSDPKPQTQDLRSEVRSRFPPDVNPQVYTLGVGLLIARLCPTKPGRGVHLSPNSSAPRMRKRRADSRPGAARNWHGCIA